MQKVLVACDSTCDLSEELLNQYGIKTLPLGIALGDTLYVDGVTVNPDMIYEHFEKTGQLPKTSALNVGECEDFFRELTADGASVVFFTIGGKLSSTYRNACLAAEAFENVHVVDTCNLSTGGGLLVMKAARLAEGGMEAKDIADTCNALAQKVDASFIVDDLEFLHKGGRCSTLAALGANVLQIKPCIAVQDGAMGVCRKYRGKFASVLKKYIADQIAQAGVIDMDLVFVTHAGCEEEICNACVEQVKELLPEATVVLTRAG